MCIYIYFNYKHKTDFFRYDSIFMKFVKYYNDYELLTLVLILPYHAMASFSVHHQFS